MFTNKTNQQRSYQSHSNTQSHSLFNSIWNDDRRFFNSSIFCFNDVNANVSGNGNNENFKPHSFKDFNSFNNTTTKSLQLPSSNTVLHPYNTNNNQVTPLITNNSNLNYRELLKPNSDVDYNVIVSKIINRTDQQSSIFLQQKLKSLSKSQLPKLVNAVLGRCVALMTNRFGNFLIQRVLEIDDVNYKFRVINEISGQIESLSFNAYATHVIQKLLIVCPENLKILIVNELLCGDIAGGMIHKNASHVWSRILETTWNVYDPPVLLTINKSMKGKWAECANTETGSLAIQTILSSSNPQKDVCLNEILNNITKIAVDKWGTSVIGYMIENSDLKTKNRLNWLLTYSYKVLTVDFYGARSLISSFQNVDPHCQLFISLILNDDFKIDNLCHIIQSNIGAQFLVNILPMLSKSDSNLLLALVHEAKVKRAGTAKE